MKSALLLLVLLIIGLFASSCSHMTNPAPETAESATSHSPSHDLSEVV